MSGPRSSRTFRPRGPGLLFTSLASAVLLLVGLVALDANQASPPTIAEFAPSALDQIKDAPPRQGSDVGSGENGEGEGGTASPSATPSATASATPSGPPPVEVPRVHTCVGDPPRQIEDPQSPPCVPYWQGDNGGATTFGVTRDEIRVAAPYGTAFTGDPTPVYQAITSFFNQKFEFYGRKLRLITYPATGDNFALPVPPDMIADATKVATEIKAFANLGYPDRKGSEQVFYDELARRKVLGVVGRDTAVGTETRFRARHPYQWSRGTTVDTQLRNYGQFACNVLNGGAPKYAGGVWPWVPQPTTRKFGVVITVNTDGQSVDEAPLKNALRACDVEPYVLRMPQSQGDTSTADARNQVLQLVDNEVTSAMCFCDINSIWDLMKASDVEGYQPEWLLGTYINADIDNSFSTISPTQSDHVIGITYTDHLQPIQDSFWYTAVRTGNPNLPPPTNAGAMAFYQDMLLLASGIQMAGPNLTPQTFADALHRTVFPNPGAGAAPWFQARVGFPNGGHAMRLDAAMYWYDRGGQGRFDPTIPGRICYVYGGRRYATDRWPRGDQPFRQGACL